MVERKSTAKKEKAKAADLVVEITDEAGFEEPIEAAAEDMWVVSRHGAPYRRCGFVFTHEEQRVVAADLTPEQLAIIQADPHLEIVYGVK